MKQLHILILVILCCFCSVTQTKSQNRDSQKCKSEVKGGKYKLAYEVRPLRGDEGLLLLIVIKPKNVNREFMIQLANRLKSTYCQEKSFQAVIFDDKTLANVDSMTELIQSKGKTILMRGFYSFNRETGKDDLEFSTKRGNSTTEIQIKMANQ